jgi:hypothetical protein
VLRRISKDFPDVRGRQVVFVLFSDSQTTSLARDSDPDWNTMAAAAYQCEEAAIQELHLSHDVLASLENSFPHSRHTLDRLLHNKFMKRDKMDHANKILCSISNNISAILCGHVPFSIFWVRDW